ncbi:MAG: formate dehydrogenase accessory sulfurtransferase FdhD [Algisphaera sp.]
MQAPIHRYRTGEGLTQANDELAVEEPLEIRIAGKAVSVTMRTPGEGDHRALHDTELAAGFLLSEGIIASAADLDRIEPCGRTQADVNVLNVFLTPGCTFDPQSLIRHVFASSSCGLCGKATLDAIHQQFPPVYAQAPVTTDVLLGLTHTLAKHQATFDRTGGLHAAGLFDRTGKLLVTREDIGRHNAVDKVIGHALQAGWATDDHILWVSGRASFEIMQKALAARIPLITAVSAPSSLAVEFAHDSGQTLIGFLREGRMNIYAGAQRVTTPQN